jgi:hypothetical protein
MRKHLLLGFVLAGSGLTVVFAQPQGRPVPPGVREANTQTNKPLEQPLPPKKRPMDAALLQREANEMAKLSAGIPEQVALVGKGQLPKDLADQLKRIEKLSKHLRSEISE